MFIIYRPQKISEIDSMLAFWNKKAKESGLKGVYFIFQKQYQPSDNTCLKSFDAQFQFQPFEAVDSPEYSQGATNKRRMRNLVDGLPKVVQSFVWKLWVTGKKNCTLHQYDKVWSQIIVNSKKAPVNVFPGAFVDWDNTARYGSRATIFQGATPERFKYWLQKLVENISDRPDDMNFIFLNAWNEWSESAYVEPDEKYGYEYLEAISSIVTSNVADNV